MPAAAKKILLVGWDGADWKIASPLIDAGEMPQFANLVENGAAGNLASQPPYLSPMLWNSIATGKRPHKHGIVGFASADPQSGRLRPMASTQRRCKALWNILGEHGLTAHVVGWFASHPAENVTGVCVSEAWPRPVANGTPWPLPQHAVHPAALAAELAELRVRPEDIDHGILRLLIPSIDEIDRRHDKRPEQLAIRLAELYTVHNAAVAILDRGPFDFLAVYYHFIDWVCHDFMDFHPPRREHIPEREFGWYNEVVRGAYRIQDLLLADLLKHAGAGSTTFVCSDHGFHSDERRPVRIPRVTAGIAAWHRPQGLFGAAGPGLARDRLVHGASQLDLAPTILHLFGLPVAGDMDGRVLTDALAEPAAPKTIPSWETAAVPQPRPRHLAALSEDENNALLDQFAALGYLNFDPRSPESPAVLNDRENRWNLAVSLVSAGLHEEALPLLEELHFARPEEPRYAYHLALTQLELGLSEEAVATAETLLDYRDDSPKAGLLLAQIALSGGDAAGSLEHLRTTAERFRDAPEMARQRGLALLKLERWAEAATAFQQALEIDREDAVAWSGLARAFLRAGQTATAIDCANEALGLNPSLAMAAFTLGQAHVVEKRRKEAGAAFQRALELNPRLDVARRALAKLHGQPYVAESLEDTRPAETIARRAAATARRLARESALVTARARSGPLTAIAPRPAPQVSAFSSQVSSFSPQVSSDLPPFIIVSGLPRSGTSLMMQMLARGGLEPMTDHHRAPDEHNPAGYFEWDEIKNLPRDPTLLDRAIGRAIKIVSPLLSYLPPTHRYRIIFMRRPVHEIARSQQRMLAPANSPPSSIRGAAASVGTALRAVRSPLEDSQLPGLLAHHQGTALTALREAAHVELLEIDYPQLIACPAAEAARVAAFVGAALLPRAADMPAAVQPSLHRERTSGGTTSASSDFPPPP